MAKKPKGFMFKESAPVRLMERHKKIKVKTPEVLSVDNVRAYLHHCSTVFDATDLIHCLEKVFHALAAANIDMDKEIKHIYMNELGSPGFTDPEGTTHRDSAARFLKGKMTMARNLELWARTGRHHYYVSATLCDMLMLTRLHNMPMSAVQAPLSAFCIVPEKEHWKTEMMQEENLWEYTGEHPLDSVLWTVRRDWWGLDMLRCSGTQIYSRRIDVVPDQYETVGELLTATKEEAPPISFALAVAIYITTRNADVILAEDSPEYRKWAKAIAHLPSGHKKSKNISKYLNRVSGKYLGINRHKLQKAAAAGGGTHASPATHWRVGHMRSQKKGPKSDPYWENIFIEPTLVGGGVAPLAKPRILT